MNAEAHFNQIHIKAIKKDTLSLRLSLCTLEKIYLHLQATATGALLC